MSLIDGEPAFFVTGGYKLEDVEAISATVRPNVILCMPEISLGCYGDTLARLAQAQPQAVFVLVTPVDSVLYQTGVLESHTFHFIAQEQLMTDLLPTLHTICPQVAGPQR